MTKGMTEGSKMHFDRGTSVAAIAYRRDSWWMSNSTKWGNCCAGLTPSKNARLIYTF